GCCDELSQRRSVMSSSNGDKAEIGILLVHGIGEQQRGQTLLNIGEPIIQWVQHWLDDMGMAWSDEEREQIPEQYRKDKNGDIEIRRSVLLPADQKIPPYVELDLEVSGYDGQKDKPKKS